MKINDMCLGMEVEREIVAGELRWLVFWREASA